MENNPLTTYFRRPAIYIKLPSDGQYYAKDTLNMTETHELPVFPMTAIDEITYRTPDALFNGQAVVDVIQSCVPNIKNAWAVPSVDLDSILVAIRIASYGHSMDIDTTCTKCGEESTYALDLRTVIEGLAAPDFRTPEIIGDLEVYFRPLNYKQMSENNVLQFEEQKLVSVIDNTDMDDKQKLNILADAFRKIGELTLKAVGQGIAAIKTPETVVQDRKHIDEFLRNCDREVFDRLRDRVIKLKTESELKPLNIKCTHCGHEYAQPFTFDMSNFFG